MREFVDNVAFMTVAVCCSEVLGLSVVMEKNVLQTGRAELLLD